MAFYIIIEFQIYIRCFWST